MLKKKILGALTFYNTALFISVSLGYIIFTPLLEPELTETQLFIAHWPVYLFFIGWAIVTYKACEKWMPW